MMVSFSFQTTANLLGRRFLGRGDAPAARAAGRERGGVRVEVRHFGGVQRAALCDVGRVHAGAGVGVQRRARDCALARAALDPVAQALFQRAAQTHLDEPAIDQRQDLCSDSGGVVVGAGAPVSLLVLFSFLLAVSLLFAVIRHVHTLKGKKAVPCIV
jgi:hypothetical protein